VFLLLALYNAVLFVGLQTFAILYLPSVSAAVVVYLQPILTRLLARLILGEPLSVAKLIGLLLGFSGIVAVSAGSISGGANAISPVGVVLGAGSALFWRNIALIYEVPSKGGAYLFVPTRPRHPNVVFSAHVRGKEHWGLDECGRRDTKESTG
jgi:drug/metabolite transporter (DMT)-like permease